MVPQVQVVSILMIVNGALVSLMGLLLSVVGPALFFILQAEQRHGRPPPQDEAALRIISVIYVVLGAVVLAAGVLNVVAGIRALRFRNRALVLVALFCNVVPLLTCYCSITSLGLMIYGLIVFFNADVARAFELAAEGVPPEEIRDRPPRRRREDDWDDEDDYQR
jgi:hypothetical protein